MIISGCVTSRDILFIAVPAGTPETQGKGTEDKYMQDRAKKLSTNSVNVDSIGDSVEGTER